MSDEIVVVEQKAEVTPGTIKTPARKVGKVGLVYGGSTSPRTQVFRPSEYNLSDIAAALDTESYFRRSKDKYIEQIWKNGFKFVGKDPDAVEYIRKRFNQIAQATGVPTKLLMEDISQQLVPYFNCVIVKVRSEKDSGGFRREDLGGRRLNPVAGYFVQDVTSIKVAKQDNGEILKYRQEIPGVSRRPEWVPEDVIHIYLSRKTGLTFGTPMVVPVLDDIRALRRMEENIEILVFQHAVPLYQYTVGLPDMPADDEEIQSIRAMINEMPTHGMVVSPERHKITAVGAEGRALRADTYLSYFKSRVLAGLGMSGIGMGEGDTANRGTASSISTHMQEATKKFQQTIKCFVDEFMIKELLLEGGFEWDVSEFDYLVELFIPEIDIDTQIKVENHHLELWNQNAITHTELRIAMGKDPMSAEEWDNTAWELLGKPKALIQAIDEPYTKPDGSVTSGAPRKEGETAPKSSVPKTSPQGTGTSANRNRPTNQYGRKGAATPPMNEGMELREGMGTSARLLRVLGYSEFLVRIKNSYELLRQDVLQSIESQQFTTKSPDKNFLLLYFNLSEKQMLEDVESYMVSAYQIGAARAVVDSRFQDADVLRYDSGFRDQTEIREESRKSVKRIFSDVQSELNYALSTPEDRRTNILYAFDSNEYRLTFLARSQLMRAYGFGYARAAKELGFEEISVSMSPDGDEDMKCRLHSPQIQLGKPISYQQLPPFHPNCCCEPKIVPPKET